MSEIKNTANRGDLVVHIAISISDLMLKKTKQNYSWSKMLDIKYVSRKMHLSNEGNFGDFKYLSSEFNLIELATLTHLFRVQI